MQAREELQKLIDALATQRDELIVRAHLARLEAQDEWRELEGKLDELRAKAKQAAESPVRRRRTCAPPPACWPRRSAAATSGSSGCSERPPPPPGARAARCRPWRGRGRA